MFSVKYEKHTRCVLFTQKILKARANLAIWNFNARNILQDYFIENKVDLTWGKILIRILIYFFIIFSILHRVWNLWKYSRAHSVQVKCFKRCWYSVFLRKERPRPRSFHLFLKQPLRIRTLRKICMFEQKKFLCKIVHLFLLFACYY